MTFHSLICGFSLLRFPFVSNPAKRSIRLTILPANTVHLFLKIQPTKVPKQKPIAYA